MFYFMSVYVVAVFAGQRLAVRMQEQECAEVLPSLLDSLSLSIDVLSLIRTKNAGSPVLEPLQLYVSLERDEAPDATWVAQEQRLQAISSFELASTIC